MAAMVGCVMPVSVMKKRLAEVLGCVGSDFDGRPVRGGVDHV
jgi:hypothetical protein